MSDNLLMIGLTNFQVTFFFFFFGSLEKSRKRVQISDSRPHGDGFVMLHFLLLKLFKKLTLRGILI
jgi:hypothetical protein